MDKTTHAPAANVVPLSSAMSTTLTPLILTYVDHRMRLGEITAKTATSVRSLLAGLDRAHGRRPLSQYGPGTIDRWREGTSHLAATTQTLYLAHVRTFSAWLHRHHGTHPDPTGHVRLAPLPRRSPVTLTGAETARLLESVAHDPRSLAIVHLLVTCGLRCVEVSRLDVDDYDGRTRTLGVVGKGGHERTIPAPVVAAEALDRYLDATGRRSGPMIRNTQSPGRRLTAATIGIYVRRWMRAAGVKRAAHDGRSAHGLRRTAGSDVMDRCGEIVVVQEMLGHARIETTARYYLRRVPLERMREAMEGHPHLSRAA